MNIKQVQDLRLDEYIDISGDYLPLSGGTLSGDLTLLGCNYLQYSSKDQNVHNYSGRNSFLQAEEAYAGDLKSYGMACTGAKGFAILSILEPIKTYTLDQLNSKGYTEDSYWGRYKVGDLYNKSYLSSYPMVKLSGDISKMVDDENIGLSGFSYSFAQSAGTSSIYVIEPEQTETSAGTVYLSGNYSDIVSYSAILKTEKQYIYIYEHDDNGLYLPSDPGYGNQVLLNFYGNHAEGGSVKAIGKYTHAEGRKTTADIRYSHAEGTMTFAGGMASHAEGFGTFAMGGYSHAAGINAFAKDKNSWVWSSGNIYYSHGTGTFNINPSNGIDGFYIGNHPLSFYISWKSQNEKIVIYSASNVVHYSKNGVETKYNSLKECLQKRSTFNGTVYFDSDVSIDLTSLDDYGYSAKRSLFNFNNRSIIFDLNGHTWTCNNTYHSRCLIAYVNSKSKITFRNGTLNCDNMGLCNINSGYVNLENLVLNTNMRIDITPAIKHPAVFYVDQKTTINFRYEYFDTKESGYSVSDYSNYSCGLFPYGSVVTKSNFPEYKNYKTVKEFLDANKEYHPTIIIDGKIYATVEDPESQQFDITSTNGLNDRMPPLIIINKGAHLKADNGLALFNNTMGEIIINGGTIIGKSAVVVRSGFLTIPFDSDCYIMGTGNNDYDPKHDSGMGTNKLNILGNAVVIESIPSKYGSWSLFEGGKGHKPEVIIEGGKFYSRYREPIGSYSHLIKGDRFEERVEKFLYGGWLNCYPSGDEYEYITGKNPDYNLPAEGYQESVPCQIIKS